MDLPKVGARGSKVSEMLWCVVRCVGSEQFSLHAKNYPREIIRPQIPLSCPSKKKAAQRDVTTETALKSRLIKCSEFPNKITLIIPIDLETVVIKTRRNQI
jgi:hypothetical protein